jgi:hypothetical protein
MVESSLFRLNYICKFKHLTLCFYTLTDIQVTGFALWNSVTNEQVRVLETRNDLLAFNNLAFQNGGSEEYTIVCLTDGPVGSTVMTAIWEDTGETTGIDNDAPFSLAPATGDEVGTTDFLADTGPTTVTCQPFCEADGQGLSGEEQRITFDTAEDCSSCNTDCIRITRKCTPLSFVHASELHSSCELLHCLTCNCLECYSHRLCVGGC